MRVPIFQQPVWNWSYRKQDGVYAAGEKGGKRKTLSMRKAIQFVPFLFERYLKFKLGSEDWTVAVWAASSFIVCSRIKAALCCVPKQAEVKSWGPHTQKFWLCCFKNTCKQNLHCKLSCIYLMLYLVQQDHRKYCYKRFNSRNYSHESTGYSCSIAPSLKNTSCIKSGCIQTWPDPDHLGKTRRKSIQTQLFQEICQIKRFQGLLFFLCCFFSDT